MLNRLAEWVHASRRRLSLSFVAVVAASFAAVAWSPPRFLGETLGVTSGVSGIYLGLAVLYLYRSSLQDKKAIRVGHSHPVKTGLLGMLFLTVGVLLAVAGSARLLWRILSEEPTSVVETTPAPAPHPTVKPAPVEDSSSQPRPKTHDDCRGQPTCQGCLRAPLPGDESRCVPTKLRKEQEFALSDDTHGLDGKLMLLVDERWRRLQADGYRGHRNDEDDPLAAAVLRLVGENGETLDEKEDFHPAVNIKAERLGDGTETFLVTQEFLCVAGRYCGWDTRFIQVHEHKLMVLEATASDGKLEQAWFTSSQAADWKLVTAGDGKLDILHRRFGFDETKGDTDTQTRFYFWEGRWRTVSDTVYANSEDREPSAQRPSGHR